MKLEGREPDALRRSTVGEQVDFVIREAQVQEQEEICDDVYPLEKKLAAADRGRSKSVPPKAGR